MNKKKLRKKKNEYFGMSPWARKQQKHRHVETYTSGKFEEVGISLRKFANVKDNDARMYAAFNIGTFNQGIRNYIYFADFYNESSRKYTTIDSTCRLCVRI